MSLAIWTRLGDSLRISFMGEYINRSQPNEMIKIFYGFSHSIFRLNKVFDDFLVEAFVDQANNNDNNHHSEAAVSSSIPIKQENGSDEIHIIESDGDEPKIEVKPESGSLDDRVVVKKKFEKVQRKTKTKPSTKCEVCKTEFRSLFELVYHRRIHLDYLNHFCRMCLQSFSSNFYRNLHEEQCKFRRYECYICGMSHLSLVGLQTHFRVHTEMRSFRIGHAIEKYYDKRNAKLQRIGKRSLEKKKPNVMTKPQAQRIDVTIDLTED